MSPKLKLIVLLSGGGTTFVNIQDHINSGDLNARIDLVISSRADAKGLERAQVRGIETAVVESKEYKRQTAIANGWKYSPDWHAMSKAINDIILPRKPDLVCLAGFMCHYFFPTELNGKVINIHPALLPSFGGQGMYGHRVHEAVIKSGVKFSGCTVHFCDQNYDTGHIIVQRVCPVRPEDTPDSLAARVFKEECVAYPDAIRTFYA